MPRSHQSASPRPGPGASLLRALRTVQRMDSAPFRQTVFEDLTRHKRTVRLARAVHQRLGKGRLSALMIAGYGLKSYLCVALPKTSARVLTASAYRNEERQFDYIASVLEPSAVAAIELDWPALLRPETWRAVADGLSSGQDVRRALRLVERINRRHGFLVACRLASTLGYSLRFSHELASTQARAVLVSSDANPYAMGLVFAAKRHGLKSIYITHGHIQDDPPQLFFDLSILDGPVAREVYEQTAPVPGDVVFRGSEGTFRPMNTDGLRRPGPRVGVFLSLIQDWPKLGRLLEDLRRVLRPERILLRFHPNEQVRPTDALHHLGRLDDVTVSYGESVLLDDARQCDLVIAGNSSCHLTVLKFGVPSVYLRDFDTLPDDYFRFARHRMVMAYDHASQLDAHEIAAFYEEPSWRERFARFDASYLDGPREAAVREALLKLLDEPPR